MLIEIERSSWESYINIINYYCRGKRASLVIWDKGKKKTLAKNQLFMSIETYFSVPTEPMLAVIMGNDSEVTLGYFIKSLKKITMEKELLRSVKRVEISVSEEKIFGLEFTTKIRKKLIPRSTVYHSKISK